MESYKRLSGKSGITAFEILEKAIILKFVSDGMYLYDYIKPGKEHIERMKVLAKKGKGLGTYVNQHVRENYRKKLD